MMTVSLFMVLTLVLMVVGSYALYKFVDACRGIDHPASRFVVRHQLWFLLAFMLLCIGTLSRVSRHSQEPVPAATNRTI